MHVYMYNLRSSERIIRLGQPFNWQTPLVLHSHYTQHIGYSLCYFREGGCRAATYTPHIHVCLLAPQLRQMSTKWLWR